MKNKMIILLILNLLLLTISCYSVICSIEYRGYTIDLKQFDSMRYTVEKNDKVIFVTPTTTDYSELSKLLEECKTNIDFIEDLKISNE